MSELMPALIVAGIAWGWTASPIDHRLSLWVYMDGEPLGLLTMTAT